MTRRSIEIDSFAHANPIPCATRIGPLIESSIIPPFNPGGRELPDTIELQIDNLFVHMGKMLEKAGAGWEDMAKITFFVQDAAESRAALNGPWEEKFPDPHSRPSRHTLEIPTSGKSKISSVFTAYVDH
ncbi:MAG: RidA family protein [Actinomycetia bacterium]|nr:RidA family protein [Actinomycetes bacterium]MCP4087658.1 RidA family protein [Actinomycetes bacterium]